MDTEKKRKISGLAYILAFLVMATYHYVDEHWDDVSQGTGRSEPEYNILAETPRHKNGFFHPDNPQCKHLLKELAQVEEDNIKYYLLD